MKYKMTACLGSFLVLFISFSLSAKAVVPVEVEEPLALNLSSAVYTDNQGELLLYDRNQTEQKLLNLAEVPEHTVGLAVTFQVRDFDYQQLELFYDYEVVVNQDNGTVILGGSDSIQENLVIKNDGTYCIVLNIDTMQGTLNQINQLYFHFTTEDNTALNTSSKTIIQINGIEYLDDESELTYIVTGEISDSFMFEEGAEEGIVVEGFTAEEGFVLEEGFVIGEELEEGSAEGEAVIIKETSTDSEVNAADQQIKATEKAQNETSVVSKLLFGAGAFLLIMAIILIVLQFMKRKSNT